MKLTVGDIFSGVGGLSVGFEQAGFKTEFANDFDEAISSAYKLNNPNTSFYGGDVRHLNYKEIMDSCSFHKGDLDVLVGGPPCQGYSMANRKRIENDERNLLFLEFVRAVKELEPKCFLIENVVGMKSERIHLGSQERRVEDSIASYFDELGYAVSLYELKAEEHGVPQYRRRVIVVGTRLDSKKDDLRSRKIGQPTKTHHSIKEWRKILGEDVAGAATLFSYSDGFGDFLNPTTVWDALSDLPKLKVGKGQDKGVAYFSEPLNLFQQFMRENSKGVMNHVSTPHSKDVLKRIKIIKQGENFTSLPPELRTKSVHSGAYGRLKANSLSPTITTRFDTPSTGRVIHPFQNRTITVREAARIQSFPDTYQFLGTRTSQGKQVGNAVPPLAALAIANMFITDFFNLAPNCTNDQILSGAHNKEHIER